MTVFDMFLLVVGGLIGCISWDWLTRERPRPPLHEDSIVTPPVVDMVRKCKRGEVLLVTIGEMQQLRDYLRHAKRIVMNSNATGDGIMFDGVEVRSSPFPLSKHQSA